MSPRWRNALLGLLALLLAALAVAWFLRNFERRPHEVPLPAYGEPTYNPLFALRESLRKDGIPAESRRKLDLAAMQLQPRDTVLMLDDPHRLDSRQVTALLDWVELGGHLLLRIPGASEDADGNDDGLLERLGIHHSGASSGCLQWQVAGQETHYEFCSSQRCTLDGDIRTEARWYDDKDAQTLAYARLRHGLGRVDVLADMDFLRNGRRGMETEPGLRDIPHQELARLMLAPNYGKGTIHLLYAAEAPSLWKLLLQRGWPVWLPLLLALLAWLWARSQRFGALLPSPREERRSLLEHVRASGEHLHRYGKSPLLYDAVRQAFLARLRRRAPLAAALSGDAQAQAIADHLQWPLARVQNALKLPASQDDTTLRERIRLLIQMRNQL